MKQEKENQIIPLIQTSEKVLSKLQKQFNNNIKRIKKLKEQVTTLEVKIREGQIRVEKEFTPIEKEFNHKRVEYVKALDKSSKKLKPFSKRERETLSVLIQEESYELIKMFEDNAELIKIHDRHSDISYQELLDEENALTKQMTEEMLRDEMGLDMDLSDIDNMSEIINDPERQANFMKDLFEKMEEKEQAEEAQKKTRKKTKAQIAKEERLKQEAQNISKTARAIYTDLVKELHPDGEQDEKLREEKTEVMKKVTKAYENDDLFELLKLQIEYRNRDLQDMHTLPEEQLKYYNKLLKDQIDELKEMRYVLENPPYAPIQEMIMRFELTKAQRTIDRAFKREILEVKDDMKRIDNTIEILENKKRTKQFLKEVFEDRQQEEMEIDFFDLLMNADLDFDEFE